MIDTDHGVIVDVETSRPIRQTEVGATRMMLDRVKEKFDLHPERLIADTACGSVPTLGWLLDRKIAPHIPVLDKSWRNDGTWTRAEFEWDAEDNQNICPEGHALKCILGLNRLRLRGPNGASDGFLLAAIDQNHRKRAKILPAPLKTRVARPERRLRRPPAPLFFARATPCFQRNRREAVVRRIQSSSKCERQYQTSGNRYFD